MFYAHFVLSKKGPLARIWLAAHWDKKLTKAHVFETNIDSSVEAIIEPKVKMALRTSGHLLLGVVRIYSRKAKYLLADCNEAFVKIKMAFRPGVVDMPEENREAAVATITLPETFHDFDTTMADLSDIDVQAQFSVNQSRPEEITMREDLGNITLVGDDGFGDMGFDNTLMQDDQLEDTLYKNADSANMLLDEALEKEGENERENELEKPMDIDFDTAGIAPQRNDDDDYDDFEPAGCDDDDDDSVGAPGDDFGGGGEIGVDHDIFGDENFIGEAGGLFEEPPVPEVPPPSVGVPDIAPPSVQSIQSVADAPVPGTTADNPDVTVQPAENTIIPDQTTLLPNEAEAFALEPLDITTIGTERKSKRKRKLVIDEQKGIASETMKLQLSDTSEIVTTLDLAPPTKKLMHWKETGGVEKLFALPGRTFLSKRVSKLFQRNLVTKPLSEDDGTKELQELESSREVPQEVVREIVREKERPKEVERARNTSLRDRESGIPQPPMMTEDSILPAEDTSAFDNSRLSVSSRRQTESFLEPPTESPFPELPDASLLPEEAPSYIEPELPPMPPMMGPASSDGEDNDDIASLPSVRDDYDSEDDRERMNEENDIFGEALPEAEVAEGEVGAEEGPAGDEEEQEERRWNKRTQYMMHLLGRNMDINGDRASFSQICVRNNRKQVASKFYALLVLKKQQAVNVLQRGPYADILITKGPRFEVH